MLQHHENLDKSAQRCPDQYVGTISEINAAHPAEDFPHRKSANSRLNKSCCIILILESPHTAEFIGTPGPAKRQTGTYIRTYITEVLGLNIYSKKDYGLILLNPIQYQCSLGVSPGCIRDEVFRSVWNGGGEEDFIGRLKDIFQDGDILVNSCTVGSSGRELRTLVQDAIEKIRPSVSLGK